MTRWLNRVALTSGVVRLLEENLTADHSRPTCVEGATLHARIKNIPSVDFVRVCPYATLGPLQRMAKCSASIQLSPFPGHCSQKLFFLFPIPTSLFFINLILFNLFSSRLCMKYVIALFKRADNMLLPWGQITRRKLCFYYTCKFDVISIKYVIIIL